MKYEIIRKRKRETSKAIPISPLRKRTNVSRKAVEALVGIHDGLATRGVSVKLDFWSWIYIFFVVEESGVCFDTKFTWE